MIPARFAAAGAQFSAMQPSPALRSGMAAVVRSLAWPFKCRALTVRPQASLHPNRAWSRSPVSPTSRLGLVSYRSGCLLPSRSPFGLRVLAPLPPAFARISSRLAVYCRSHRVTYTIPFTHAPDKLTAATCASHSPCSSSRPRRSLALPSSRAATSRAATTPPTADDEKLRAATGARTRVSSSSRRIMRTSRSGALALARMTPKRTEGTRATSYSASRARWVPGERHSPSTATRATLPSCGAGRAETEGRTKSTSRFTPVALSWSVSTRASSARFTSIRTRC